MNFLINYIANTFNKVLNNNHLEKRSFQKISEKLWQSQESYKKLFEEHTAVKFLIKPDDGSIIDANQAAAEYYGWTREELKHMNVSQINNLSPEEIKIELENACANKRNHFEFRHKLANGSIRDVEVYSSKINISGNDLLHSIIHDVTEKKRAFDELKKAKEIAEESEEKLRLVANNLENGMIYQVIALSETERKFTFISDAVKRLYGCTPDEAKNDANLIYNKIHKDDIEGITQKELIALQNNSVFKSEVRVINPDGTIRWSYFVSSPRTMKGQTYWDGIEIDITEQKNAGFELLKAKEKAEENEKQFRLLFENMEQGFALHEIIYDESNEPYDFRYVMINKAFENLTGLNAEKMVGKTVREFLPNVEEIWIKNYGIVAKTGQPLHFENFAQDLNKYYDVVAYSPKKDYFAVIFNDITEVKEYQKELLAAKEKAEENDRLKTAFLQNMSHEIRTPMNAIMGFSNLLEESFDDKQKLAKYSQIINQRGEDLLEIINDILDISKIESGSMTVHPEEVNINQLFEELINFFNGYKNRMEKSHIDFNLKTYSETSDISIITDKGKLKQILINLITNAFKFTEQGSIEGGCKLVDTKLTFFISDTGIGIPIEKQNQIFERFSQFYQGKKLNTKGTGLGLSIVKGLVNLLGGEVNLQSEPGKGSTFSFSIPYQKGKINSLNLDNHINIDYKSFINKRLLIVEDDLYNLEYLKEILSDTGIEILYTGSGNEAVEICSLQHIDLVLMDIQLPDINGYDATKQIHEIKPHTKIIAQTAYALFGEKNKAMEAGCVGYISKPIKKENLISLINKNLNNR